MCLQGHPVSHLIFTIFCQYILLLLTFDACVNYKLLLMRSVSLVLTSLKVLRFDAADARKAIESSSIAIGVSGLKKI